MQDFVLSNYLWFKAFHIVAMVSWMAALLYLPRLFVYHACVAAGTPESEMLKVMERRLYKYIMVPAMMATWTFGFFMLWANFESIMSLHWMHGKLTLVVLLTGIHHVYGAWRKKFAKDANTHSQKFYRWWNEAPTILLIGIVILAVVKPF